MCFVYRPVHGPAKTEKAREIHVRTPATEVGVVLLEIVWATCQTVSQYEVSETKFMLHRQFRLVEYVTSIIKYLYRDQGNGDIHVYMNARTLAASNF